VAPLAVKLAVVDGQIVGELTVTVGNGFTVTVATAVPVQPDVVPVTVYVVVVPGVALAVFVPVDVAPALQVYDVAPEAVSAAVWPAQIVGEFTVTVGGGFTVTVPVFVVEHPVKV